MAEQGNQEHMKLLEKIGEGGYGIVYLIQHEQFGRTAYKKLSIYTDKSYLSQLEKRSKHTKDFISHKYSTSV